MVVSRALQTSCAKLSAKSWFVFFFQAEDGIRDLTVTGVQTCALPIFPMSAAFIPMKCMDQIAPPPRATEAPVTEPITAAQVRACGIAMASCNAVYEPNTEIRYDSPTRSGSY